MKNFFLKVVKALAAGIKAAKTTWNLGDPLYPIDSDYRVVTITIQKDLLPVDVESLLILERSNGTSFSEPLMSKHIIEELKVKLFDELNRGGAVKITQHKVKPWKEELIRYCITLKVVKP